MLAYRAGQQGCSDKNRVIHVEVEVDVDNDRSN